MYSKEADIFLCKDFLFRRLAEHSINKFWEKEEAEMAPFYFSTSDFLRIS